MAKKEAGGKSSSQNDFLEPLAPENVTATDIGTNRAYNDGALTVTWTIDALSPAADTYSIDDATAGVLSSGALPAPVDGLYTVIVESLTSASSYTAEVSLTNASGTSASVAASAVIVTTIPQAPQNVTVTSTVANTDNIAWSDGQTGGSAITSTYAVSSDQAQTPGNVTLSSNPFDITEVGDTTQNYTLYHVNANGTSIGAASGNVTTLPPFSHLSSHLVCVFNRHGGVG